MADMARMMPRPSVSEAVVPLRHAVSGLLAVTAASAGGPLAAGAVAALVAALLWWHSRLPGPAGLEQSAVAALPTPSVGPGPTLAADSTVLLYRPLRSLPELHLRGVEAELRWRHPIDGLVPPAEWPAERTAALAGDLIAGWVGPACARFAAWLPGLRARGAATLWLRLPLSLLEHDSLAASLAQALTTHGLDPSMLVLRVPLHVNGRQARLPEAAHRLQALGVTIAVDAFGAGPASLTHLDQLPVRTVCLAPSFVARAGPNTPQRWVVESTARLAQSMGMSTLAEGVAQETQVLALAAMGCELGVGDVCGPWLEAGDWTQRWSSTQAARAA
jgi:EAL domain-containing protein (putative c-di-GMP-specific phosphodiesterase class I)